MAKAASDTPKKSRAKAVSATPKVITPAAPVAGGLTHYVTFTNGSTVKMKSGPALAYAKQLAKVGPVKCGVVSVEPIRGSKLAEKHVMAPDLAPTSPMGGEAKPKVAESGE